MFIDIIHSVTTYSLFQNELQLNAKKKCCIDWNAVLKDSCIGCDLKIINDF